MKISRHHLTRSAKAARSRIAHQLIDALESRRLFTLNLSIQAGALLIREDAHVDNNTIIQTTGGGSTIQIEELTDTLSDTPALFNLGWNQSNDAQTETGPTSSFSSITIDTNDGNDQLKIISIGTPTTIYPSGAAQENITFGDQFSTIGAQGVTAQVYFNGTNAKSLSIDIDDRLNPNTVSGTISSTNIQGLTPGAIYFSNAVAGGPTAITNIGYSEGTGGNNCFIQQSPTNTSPVALQFDPSGPSDILIQQLNANSSVQVQPQTNGIGNVDIGDNGLLSPIQGTIQVFGNQGSATLTVDDSADTAPRTFSSTSSGSEVNLSFDGSPLVTFAYPLTKVTLNTDIFANTVNLDLGVFDSDPLTTIVNLAGENDTVNVTQIPQGSTFDLTGAAGITSATFDAQAIHSANVNITDTIGNVALTLNGSSLFQAQAVDVNSLFTQGLGTTTFVYTNANLSSLSLIGGTDFDNFTIVPNSTFPITVDGGKDSAGISDRLAISNPKLFPNIALAFTAGSTTAGTYTITGEQPINFIRVATLDPDFGNLSGTVYNAQTTAALPGATVFVDQNNNGTFDTGEPTTTTDATGSFTFSGLPVGTFNLLSTDNGFALTAPVSITIATGVLTSATSLTMIPAPNSTGPDLTVSTTTAPSKLATIKPKVTVKITNLSATTAAATIQILLFASTDQTLDPNDIALFTTTEPILLKTKKVKAFTFTPATPAALTKGAYYILAAVDTTNAIIESNESNNVSPSPKTILLAPPYVDLTGRFAPLPKSFKKAKILPVTLLLQNLGTIPATDSIDITLYASTDQTLDQSDTALATNSSITLRLPPNKTQPAKFKLSLAALTPGSYYLIAKLNTTQSQPESDLTNNTIFSLIPIAIS